MSSSSQDNHNQPLIDDNNNNSKNSSKPLLTQEFNTIPSQSTSNSFFLTMNSENENNTATNATNGFTCPSLPFNVTEAENPISSHLTPSFIYPQQFAFPCYTTGFPIPVMDQMHQYIMMTPRLMNNYNYNNNNNNSINNNNINNISLPLSPSPKSSNTNKRVKINQETPVNNSGFIIDQLNSFKMSLKSSFDRNLQKLEVLDRLVHTVTIKGNIQVEHLHGALELLSVSKDFLKQLVTEQVDLTASLTSDLRCKLIPELLCFFKSFISKEKDLKLLTETSKGELIDKLRREEDSHLTDLSILSTRNKELQKDQRNLKEQLEKLQAEYFEAQKSANQLKESHEEFISQVISTISSHLKDENDLNIESQGQAQNFILLRIEKLFEEKISSTEKIKNIESELRKLCFDLRAMRTDQSELLFTTNFDSDFSSEVINLLCEQFTILNQRFEQIYNLQENCYKKSFEKVQQKVENLIQSQSQLAHQALSVRMRLQSQLADSFESTNRLRQQCQQLTNDLASAASEIDKQHFKIQVKDSEFSDLKQRYDNLHERNRALEHDLSMKNQEARSLGIRVQSLEVDLNEAETSHKHDILALERKISILETKLATSQSFQTVQAQIPSLNEVDDSFRLSNIQMTKTIVEPEIRDISVSSVPPTVALKQRNFTITFTGIRDVKLQKDLFNWLNELGATVHNGADFNDEITHVLAPPGYKSIRVLAASLTGKWIVPIRWVEACHRSKEFVPELSQGGFNNTHVRPFRFRTLWMSHAFAEMHKSHPVYPTAALRTLLEKLGKARWCETAGLADFLLVTEKEKDSKMIGSAKGVLLTLNNLINMIPIE